MGACMEGMNITFGGMPGSGGMGGGGGGGGGGARPWIGSAGN